MGSKIKTTGHIGENWGARLKLTRYEEHWQAQWGAMGKIGEQLQTLAKHCGAAGNVGEHLQTLGRSYKRWGAMAGAGARSLFLLKVS